MAPDIWNVVRTGEGWESSASAPADWPEIARATITALSVDSERNVPVLAPRARLALE